MNGQRFETSTGLFVEPQSWVESTQQLKGKTEETRTIRNRLDKIITKIQDIYNQLDSLGAPFDVQTIRSKFLGLSNGQGFLEVFDSIIKDMKATLGQPVPPTEYFRYFLIKK